MAPDHWGLFISITACMKIVPLLIFLVAGLHVHSQNYDFSLRELQPGSDYPAIKGKAITGEQVNSELFGDSIVVINLWFAACQPCLSEIPGLNKLVESYTNKPVIFLAISFDKPEHIQSFLEHRAFNFKHLYVDLKQLQDTYKPFGFPTTYIIQNGKVLFSDSGALPGEEAAEEMFKKFDEQLKKFLKL